MTDQATHIRATRADDWSTLQPDVVALDRMTVAELHQYVRDFPAVRQAVLDELESRRRFVLDADELELIRVIGSVRKGL